MVCLASHLLHSPMNPHDQPLDPIKLGYVIYYNLILLTVPFFYYEWQTVDHSRFIITILM